MTERIRWIDSPDTSTTAFIGWTGSIHESQFAIYKPDHDGGDYILASQLPGLDEKRSCSSDVGRLKAEAERWLEEFVSSLGAVFPEVPAADPDCEECGFGLPRHDQDCSFGPEAFKTHQPGCVCWDCQGAREEAATAAGEKEQ